MEKDVMDRAACTYRETENNNMCYLVLRFQNQCSIKFDSLI